MFTWLKKLFGFEAEFEKAFDEAAKEVLAEPAPAVEQAKEPAKPKKQAKKPAAKPKKKTSKKVDSINLDSMSKADLLAHAKANGIKANASLKKDEILARIKDAG